VSGVFRRIAGLIVSVLSAKKHLRVFYERVFSLSNRECACSKVKCTRTSNACGETHRRIGPVRLGNPSPFSQRDQTSGSPGKPVPRWTGVRVSRDFEVRNVCTIGLPVVVVLGNFSEAGGVQHSSLETPRWEDRALIDHCLQSPHPCGEKLRPKGILARLHSKKTSFGVGSEIKPAWRLPAGKSCCGIGWTSFGASVSDRSEAAAEWWNGGLVSFDRNVIAPGVRACHCPWLDECTWAHRQGCKELSSSKMRSAGNREEPVFLGTGIQVVDAIFQAGVEIDAGPGVTVGVSGMVGRTAPSAGDRKPYRPNSIIGGGEVTASFLGPLSASIIRAC